MSQLCPERGDFLAAAAMAGMQESSGHVYRYEGARGPVTTELQRVFHDALRGRDPRYAAWLDHVEVPAPTT